MCTIFAQADERRTHPSIRLCRALVERLSEKRRPSVDVLRVHFLNVPVLLLQLTEDKPLKQIRRTQGWSLVLHCRKGCIHFKQRPTSLYVSIHL